MNFRKHIMIILIFSAFLAASQITVDDSWLEYSIERELEQFQSDGFRILIIDLPKKALLPDSIFTVHFTNPFRIGTHREVVYLHGDDWKRGLFWRYLCEVEDSFIAANRNIRRDEIIRSDDIKKIHGWVPNETVVMDFSDVIGKMAKENLIDGEMIFQDQLARNYDVALRDDVKVIWRENGIQLISTGRALDRGDIGEIIRVRVNRKTLDAEVVAPKEVVIK